MKRVIMFLLLVAHVAVISASDIFPEWNRKIPQLLLTNVDISADSFTKVLTDIEQYLGIRTIAYFTNDIRMGFTFRCKQCTVSNVLDQVSATYDSLMWSQDQKTGVIWFTPKNGDADSWLKYTVRVKRPQLGLRMYTDVLDGLSLFTDRKIGIQRRGFTFLNIFDYTMDLPASLLSLRQIVSLCASYDPHISFSLVPRADYQGYLIVDLGTTWNNAEPKRLVPEFTYFWDAEVRQPSSGILRSDGIFFGLSNPDAHVRAAAEKAMSLLSFMVSYDDILKIPASDEQRMWAANGLLNEIVHDPKLATYPFALEILTSQANQDRLLQLHDPALAVLSAFQIGRCGKGTRLLTKLLNTNVPSGKLLRVKSELFRMARESQEIRNAIKGNRPRWGDLTADEIDQLISPDQMIFSAP